MIRVVNVKGLNKPDQRSGVTYVGRAFAGWPGSPWGNYARLSCPDEFREWLIGLADLDEMLERLWAACDRGRLPLGCYCGAWQPGDPPLACHAYVWATLLIERYGTGEAT